MAQSLSIFPKKVSINSFSHKSVKFNERKRWEELLEEDFKGKGGSGLRDLMWLKKILVERQDLSFKEKYQIMKKYLKSKNENSFTGSNKVAPVFFTEPNLNPFGKEERVGGECVSQPFCPLSPSLSFFSVSKLAVFHPLWFWFFTYSYFPGSALWYSIRFLTFNF